MASDTSSSSSQHHAFRQATMQMLQCPSGTAIPTQLHQRHSPSPNLSTPPSEMNPTQASFTASLPLRLRYPTDLAASSPSQYEVSVTDEDDGASDVDWTYLPDTAGSVSPTAETSPSTSNASDEADVDEISSPSSITSETTSEVSTIFDDSTISWYSWPASDTSSASEIGSIFSIQRSASTSTTSTIDSVPPRPYLSPFISLYFSNATTRLPRVIVESLRLSLFRVASRIRFPHLPFSGTAYFMFSQWLFAPDQVARYQVLGRQRNCVWYTRTENAGHRASRMVDLIWVYMVARRLGIRRWARNCLQALRDW